jgi:hypothetical protein
VKHAPVTNDTITLGITGSADFVHRPIFKKLLNITFRKLDLFLSSGEWRETLTVLGSLERANFNHRKLLSQRFSS